MQLTPYETYKDSGIQWLGKIPEHWEVKRIKDVVKKIGSGVTPKGGSEVYVESGIPFLRSQNVHDEGLRLEEVSFITDEINGSMKSSQIRPDDIVLNITGASIGRTCIIPNTLPLANISQHILFLRFKKERIAFVSKYLKSYFIKKYTLSIQAGASKEALNMGQTLNFPLLIPPLAEQTAIAQYLDQKTSLIDRKNALLEQKISTYQELRKSLINETVCRGLDKSTPLKDSGIEWIGAIPKHWDVQRGKKVFVEIKNRSVTGIGDLLSVSEYHGISKKVDTLEDDDIHLSRAESLVDYKLCKKGDLVINIMLAWKGALGISPFDGLVSPSYAIYRIYPKSHTTYHHYLLRTDIYKAEFKRNSTGIIDSRLRLYTDSFFNIPIISPPLAEQTAIAKFLDEKTKTIDTIIENLKTQITTLQAFRKTLINDVVTGKIRVNDPTA